MSVFRVGRSSINLWWFFKKNGSIILDKSWSELSKHFGCDVGITSGLVKRDQWSYDLERLELETVYQDGLPARQAIY